MCIAVGSRLVEIVAKRQQEFNHIRLHFSHFLGPVSAVMGLYLVFVNYLLLPVASIQLLPAGRIISWSTLHIETAHYEF